MTLPSEITAIIDVDSAAEVHIGQSKSRVFKLNERSGRALYLKIADSAYVTQELEQEIKVMEWLAERAIPTPRAVRFVKEDAKSYFLMTAVAGESMADSAQSLGAKECLRLGAMFLKRLHSLDIEGCPFNHRLTVTRALALANLEGGLVDEDDLDSENQGRAPREIYQDVLSEVKEDPVFTHGDFCFPNIITLNGAINGVVDLGRAGVADRYQDIALFLRSFQTNIGEPEIGEFLKVYGLIERLDQGKISFFKKLDEFF